MSAATFSFFINLLFLTLPLYLLQVYSRVVASQSKDTLFYLTIAALGAFVVFGVLTAVRTRLLLHLGEKFDALLSEPVLSALIARAVRPRGVDNAQGLRDLATVRSFLAGADMASLMDALWTPIFIFVIFLIHPLLGIVGAAGAAVLLLLAFINEIVTRKPLSDASANAISAHGIVESNLRNAEVIEAMGMRGDVLRRWARDNGQVVEAQSRAGTRGATISALCRSIRFGVQILMLAAGAYLMLERSITIGMMIVPILLLGRALAPVDMAISTWKNLVNARGAYQRLTQLMDNGWRDESAMPLPAPTGALDVERVSFKLRAADEPTLRGVNFSLEPGETLGIIGPTAAGKSTLAKLIVGVWRPVAGHIRLDRAEVSTWSSEDLGRYIGYLPQEVRLFEGTVRENIDRFTEADSEAVVAAARAAHVHQMILELADGYDTRIGPGGVVLSGGQCQRIALARALFGEPRLLVLDEPNAHLDAEGEMALQKTLRHARRAGITAIVITHRPAILSEMDRILHLRAGRVELIGTRDEVMAKIAEGNRRAKVVSIAASQEIQPVS